MVGLGRVELPTSRLSGVRSNRLSYRPLVCGIVREYCASKETRTVTPERLGLIFSLKASIG